MHSFEKIREDFPITEHLAYLNNAAYTPMPNQTIQAIRDAFAEYSLKGPDAGEFYSEMKDRANKARKKVADTICGESEGVVYTESATQGINFVANMIPFKKGDEIILRDSLHEHSSNFLPWLHLSKLRGVKLVKLKIDRNGSFDVDELQRAISKKTKLIALTHLLYNTGAIMPVEEAGKIAQEEDVFYLLDASQSAGCVHVDTKAIKCDFMAFPASKWLLGPLGVGVLYCNPRSVEDLPPPHFGNEAAESYSEEDFAYQKMPFKLQEGFRNWPGVMGLASSIDYISSIGFQRVRERSMALAEIFREELQKRRDVEVYGPDDPKERNSIVAFEIKGKDPSYIVGRLLKRKVALATRELGAKKSIIRVSPYFYNNAEEIEKTLRLLEQIV